MTPSVHKAVAVVYDITDVLEQLAPLVTAWALPNQRDSVIDAWLIHAIDSFQIVEVRDRRYGQTASWANTSEWIGLFNSADKALSCLWKLLWIPFSMSGCQVVLHRHTHTLYLIAIDPQSTPQHTDALRKG